MNALSPAIVHLKPVKRNEKKNDFFKLDFLWLKIKEMEPIKTHTTTYGHFRKIAYVL